MSSAKTVLVTGAARRLGRAIALELAGRGLDVVIHHRRSRAEAGTLAAEVRAMGRGAWLLEADLSDADAAGRLVPEAIAAAGALDLLVNNASEFPAGRLPDCPVADLARSLEVNAWAPLALSRAFAAAARAANRPGCIVNLLDARMEDFDRAHFAYHVSKRVLRDLTRMMALEFAPGVRVNAVAPGLILPPEGEGEAYLARLAHTNPLNRHGDAADVARAVAFLWESGFVTGQTVFVDGGRHMKGCVYG